MSRNVPEQTTRALGPRFGITRACSSSLAAAVAVALVGTSLPVVAAEAPVPLTLLRAAASPQDTAAPASVLGLDSDDGKAGRTLTIALRKAFANRGLSGGEEISLEEMRLTMGCDNDSASCLAAGGQTLGVRRLVFGYLRSVGKGKYQLDIQILDTEASALEAQASVDLTKSQLSSGNVDATAVEIVNQLMPAESSDSDLPPRTDPLPVVDEDEDEDQEPIVEPEPRESRIKFGLEKPTPRWKWVGFGTSLGLTVLAGGATIGMGVWLTMKNGGFRARLLEEADASERDTNPTNDIPSNLPTGTDLCAVAASRPTDSEGNPLGDEGEITNEAVFKVCRNGRYVRYAQIASGVGTAVFGLSTLVFTGLLLVHRRKPGVDAMVRHRVQLGMSPNLDGRGGLSIAGGVRF
ncbi:MAG: hypothetical protein AB1Z98_05715 [Nannocystaceae bacterium]